LHLAENRRDSRVERRAGRNWEKPVDRSIPCGNSAHTSRLQPLPGVTARSRGDSADIFRRQESSASIKAEKMEIQPISSGDKRVAHQSKLRKWRLQAGVPSVSRVCSREREGDSADIFRRQESSAHQSKLRKWRLQAGVPSVSRTKSPSFLGLQTKARHKLRKNRLSTIVLVSQQDVLSSSNFDRLNLYQGPRGELSSERIRKRVRRPLNAPAGRLKAAPIPRGPVCLSVQHFCAASLHRRICLDKHIMEVREGNPPGCWEEFIKRMPHLVRQADKTGEEKKMCPLCTNFRKIEMTSHKGDNSTIPTDNLLGVNPLSHSRGSNVNEPEIKGRSDRAKPNLLYGWTDENKRRRDRAKPKLLYGWTDAGMGPFGTRSELALTQAKLFSELKEALAIMLSVTADFTETATPLELTSPKRKTKTPRKRLDRPSNTFLKFLFLYSPWFVSSIMHSCKVSLFPLFAYYRQSSRSSDIRVIFFPTFLHTAAPPARSKTIITSVTRLMLLTQHCALVHGVWIWVKSHRRERLVSIPNGCR
ncbi:hypothetical protein RRG08_015698, partial [Elysia crispata]